MFQKYLSIFSGETSLNNHYSEIIEILQNKIKSDVYNIFESSKLLYFNFFGDFKLTIKNIVDYIHYQIIMFIFIAGVFYIYQEISWMRKMKKNEEKAF